MFENMEREVEKTIQRGRLRRTLGREYYILRRKLRWWIERKQYVRPPSVCRPAGEEAPYSVFSHRSMMLRPLKDVQMYLQHNKVTNLRLAVGKIDGVAIRPGEKFSVWRLVGRPSKRKGYLPGLVIHNGHISEGTGGGLCQLGNLLYWMALHTDLDVTERWRHSFDVFPDVNRTVPFACGATLGYNYLDLEITNNTDDTYVVRLWQDGEYLHGEIMCGRRPGYTIEVYETDHEIRRQWWGGYTRHNRVWKRRTAGRGPPEDILVCENPAVVMYEPLLPWSCDEEGKE